MHRPLSAAVSAVAAFAAVAVPPPHASAADAGWLGGNGPFHTPSNWSTGTVPGASDDVYFFTEGLFDVSFNQNATTLGLFVETGDVLLFGTGSQVYTLADPGLSLAVAYLPDAQAALTVAEMTLSVQGPGYVGADTGATGILSINDGGLLDIYGELYFGTFGGTGILTAEDGGNLLTADVVLGDDQQAAGAAVLTGEGTRWQAFGLVVAGFDGVGNIELQQGATFEAEDLFIAVGSTAEGFVRLTGEGSDMRITGDAWLGGSALGSGGFADLFVLDDATATIDGVLRFYGGGLVTVDGGTLTVGNISLEEPGGAIDFRAGTVGFNDSLFIDQPLIDFVLLGNALTAGKTLAVAGTAVVEAPLVINGGELVAGDVQNPQQLDFRSGTVRLTDAPISVTAGGRFGNTFVAAPLQNWAADVVNVAADGIAIVGAGASLAAEDSFTNAGEIRLMSNTARLAAPTLVNTGTLRGFGRLDGALDNRGSGTLRPDALQRIVVTGDVANAGTLETGTGEIEIRGGLVNTGTSSVQGGRLTATNLVNNAGSIDAASATLRFNGNLANSGSLGFTGGVSNVYGEIFNTGQIVLAQQSRVTFHGPLQHDNTLSVGPGSVASFLGDVTGPGGFGGGGEVELLAGYNPSAGPATTTFAGDLRFGGGSRVVIELADGSSDRLEVSGALFAAGVLAAVPLDGYIPLPGTRIEIATFASRTGDFVLDFDTPFPGLFMEAEWEADSLALVFSALPGDATLDGVVNLADFNVLATSFGREGDWLAGDFTGDGIVNLADFNVLATNFGTSAANLAMLEASLPEPAATAWLLAVAAAGRRRARRQ
ncbi:MAG: hypothetical protein ACFCVE_09670 [Phycisphaerae bacterium]